MILYRLGSDDKEPELSAFATGLLESVQFWFVRVPRIGLRDQFALLRRFIILRGIPRPSGRGGIARRASARLVFPVSLLLLVRGLNVIAVAIGSLCDGAMLVRDALNGTV
jgi:hypothetical protein